jgi:hypothetical protein
VSASVVGVHLEQNLQRVSAGAHSWVVQADHGGVVHVMASAREDGELLEAVGAGHQLIVADAPLAVPGEGGRRDIDRVLQWCDIPLFPAAGRRLRAVHGGARGAALAPALNAASSAGAWEASPDQVLRQLAWEAGEGASPEAMDLARYRELWPLVAAPAYRPRGRRPARPEGLRAAWTLLSGALDMGGWAPEPADDDAATEDAGRLDALACALAGVRALKDPPRAARLGDPVRGRILVPCDSHLSRRIAITLHRLREEGAIAI